MQRAQPGGRTARGQSAAIRNIVVFTVLSTYWENPPGLPLPTAKRAVEVLDSWIIWSSKPLKRRLIWSLLLPGTGHFRRTSLRVDGKA